mmetsp:Transcript_65857/g.166821  ORF Transcript_65857/g.166821 Transcript_65857/m.166821 type:complete len:238 (+) Transcript_65857:356-1069(+)
MRQTVSISSLEMYTGYRPAPKPLGTAGPSPPRSASSAGSASSSVPAGRCKPSSTQKSDRHSSCGPNEATSASQSSRTRAANSTLRPASRPIARPKSASFATSVQEGALLGAAAGPAETTQQWKPPRSPGASGEEAKCCHGPPTSLWYCPGRSTCAAGPEDEGEEAEGVASRAAKQTLPVSVETQKSGSNPSVQSLPKGPLTSFLSICHGRAKASYTSPKRTPTISASSRRMLELLGP